MKIIQNFTSNKHYQNIPIIDILIWSCGLNNLKVFKHKLKLYCKSSDIKFLKDWGLFDFYDEIDTSFLETFESTVNETNFWSIRKLACIEHEFDISAEPFIYMDTDIIMNIPLSNPSDLLVWGLEPQRGVYLSWEHYSLPYGYSLPDWLKNTHDAYNCGVLAFKNKEFFNLYLKEFYKFTEGNVCLLSESAEKTFLDSEKRAIWACTAEQRILKGLAEKLNWDVTAVNTEAHEHMSESGIHYYILRNNWRQLRDRSDFLSEDIKNIIIFQLNSTVQSILAWLPQNIRALFLDRSEELFLFWEQGIELTTYF